MIFASKAIVLSKKSFGEADAYVEFLTQQWGVITTLAKAAKKSQRRYVGGLDLFCHDEIFIKGDPKERPYLQELSVINSFTGLRDDIDKVMLGGRLLSWVKRLANVQTPIPYVYSLLGQTLALIEKEPDTSRLELLGVIFNLKLITHIGLKPNVEACARCDNEVGDAETLFDIESGGVLCRDCTNKSPLKLFLRLSSLERSFVKKIDQLKLSQWNEVEFPIEPTLELRRILTQFASYHTHARLP